METRPSLTALLLLGEGSLLASSAPGRTALGKVQCWQSSSYSPVCPHSLNLSLFLSLSPPPIFLSISLEEFWKFSSGNLDFYKVSLFCQCLPKSINILQNFPNRGQVRLRPIHRLLLVPHTELSAVTSAQMDRTPSCSLEYGASPEALLFMNECYLWKREQKAGASYSTIMLMSLFHLIRKVWKDIWGEYMEADRICHALFYITPKEKNLK